MTGEKLLLWQDEFIKLNSYSDNEDINRNINMLVAGPSTGKSFLKKYMIDKKIAKIIPSLDEDDIMEQILNENKTLNSKIYIFDELYLNGIEVKSYLNICQKLKDQGYIIWIFTNILPSKDECGDMKFSYWTIDNENLGYENWKLSKFEYEE